MRKRTMAQGRVPFPTVFITDRGVSRSRISCTTLYTQHPGINRENVSARYACAHRVC